MKRLKWTIGYLISVILIPCLIMLPKNRIWWTETRRAIAIMILILVVSMIIINLIKVIRRKEFKKTLVIVIAEVLQLIAFIILFCMVFTGYLARNINPDLILERLSWYRPVLVVYLITATVQNYFKQERYRKEVIQVKEATQIKIK